MRLIDFVLMTIDKDWEFEFLSMNPYITYDDIKKNPQLDWCYETLSNNPNIIMNNVLENLDKH